VNNFDRNPSRVIFGGSNNAAPAEPASTAAVPPRQAPAAASPPRAPSGQKKQ
jgi:phospholipid/cholesterol/gamma-HCH transport system substrate-binding protein